MSDAQPKCKTFDCGSDAEFETFWPGNTTYQCMPCAARAVRVAEAMGVSVEIRPLVKGPMTS